MIWGTRGKTDVNATRLLIAVWEDNTPAEAKDYAAEGVLCGVDEVLTESSRCDILLLLP